MKITITARHFSLDPEDRLHAESHLEPLARFAHRLGEAHLTITAADHRYTAEVTLQADGHDLAGRVEAHTARAAITGAIERLDHQLRKLKDRRLERSRGDRTRAADTLQAPEESPDEGGDWTGRAAEE